MSGGNFRGSLLEVYINKVYSMIWFLPFQKFVSKLIGRKCECLMHLSFSLFPAWELSKIWLFFKRNLSYISWTVVLFFCKHVWKYWCALMWICVQNLIRVWRYVWINEILCRYDISKNFTLSIFNHKQKMEKHSRENENFF